VTVFLSALPVLSTILALAFGARSLHAALFGVGAAALAILLAFPIPMDSIAPAIVRWTPILAEVLLIVGGGLLLSEVLRQASGQAALANWIDARSGQGVGAVLLVVHGITPFAESLTGFGIGVTIGIPLLAHFGLPARKVVVIGLLGLCAVPWGSMGPGTLIAATMSDLPFHDLGVTSAIISLIPFVVTGIVAAWLASPPQGRGIAVLQGILSGIVLTLSVTAANAMFGTPPAGALGALVVIALHFLRGNRRGGTAPLASVGRKALATYAVLLGGVLSRKLALHRITRALAVHCCDMVCARFAGTGTIAADMGVVAAGRTGHRPVHCAGHPHGSVGHGRLSGADTRGNRRRVSGGSPVRGRGRRFRHGLQQRSKRDVCNHASRDCPRPRR
jgi:lactate permease